MLQAYVKYEYILKACPPSLTGLSSYYDDSPAIKNNLRTVSCTKPAANLRVQ
jgi:hypothetical protein